MPLSGLAVAIGRNAFDPPAPVVPVFDIHNRTSVLHDSGDTPDASGILYYHDQGDAYGGRLELIPSNSGAQPVVTAILFNAIDDAGTNTIGTSLTTVDLPTEKINTHPDIFKLVSDEVHIQQSGTYAVQYNAAYTHTTTTRTSSRTQIEVISPGGSWVEVDGTRGYAYHRTNGDAEDTSSGFAIIDVSQHGRVRLRAIIEGGTTSITQLIDGIALTIRKLK